MNIASLPMYDFPEIRKSLDGLWAGFARHLKRQGCKNVPQTLVHNLPLAKLWKDPHLLLSQCCGFDLVNSYADKLIPLATPEYGAPGCEDCDYASVVVVADHVKDSDVLNMRGAICVVNGRESQSGMNSLRTLIAPVSNQGCFFSKVLVSGSHADSLEMLREGRADVAAIDCVTHALLDYYRPRALSGTRVLGLTYRTPAIPYVTQARTTVSVVERLRTALLETFADPGLTDLRRGLFLKDIRILPVSDYHRIIRDQRYADHFGYYEMCGG